MIYVCSEVVSNQSWGELQGDQVCLAGCRYWALSLALAHRASTAFRAISLLSSAVSLAARILPPFDPPSFPKATAFGFFFLAMDDLETNLPNGRNQPKSS